MTNFGGQIGNENLASRKSIKPHDITTIDYSNFASNGSFIVEKAQEKTHNGFMFDYGVSYKPNTYYTMKCNIQLISGSIKYMGYHSGLPSTELTMYLDGKAISSSTDISSIFNDKQEHTLVYVYRTGATLNNTSSETNQTYVQPNKNDASLKYKMKVSHLKLEEGTTNTPWCPAKAEQTGENIRIWAGATYTDRDNAPFRVNQNGELFASKGTFSGKVASEEVNVGRIHLHDDAIVIDTSVAKVDEHGEIHRIQTLDDSGNPYIKLSPSLAQFNVDLNLGSTIKYKHSDNRLLMNGASLELTGPQALSKIVYNPGDGPTSGLNFFATYNGGQHVIRHASIPENAGALIFDNEGVRGTKGDFVFTQGNFNGQVKVHIDGEANIKEKITNTKNNIEQRYTSKGVYFYAG